MTKKKEYRKKYYLTNKEKEQEQSKNFFKNNPNYQKEYYKLNKEKKLKYFKEYREKNNHIISWRKMLWSSMRRLGKKKESSSIDLLGYSAKELKEHLESKFLEGMSWENRNSWHIDHIIPVTKFDKNTDIKIVNALSNLQPLWKKDNISKGNR